MNMCKIQYSIISIFSTINLRITLFVYTTNTTIAIYHFVSLNENNSNAHDNILYNKLKPCYDIIKKISAYNIFLFSLLVSFLILIMCEIINQIKTTTIISIPIKICIMVFLSKCFINIFFLLFFIN